MPQGAVWLNSLEFRQHLGNGLVGIPKCFRRIQIRNSNFGKFQNNEIFEIKKNQIRDVRFGKNCKIIEPVNIYGSKIGNNVFIGPFVEIQNGKMNKKSDWLFFAIAIIAGFSLMRWFFG